MAAVREFTRDIAGKAASSVGALSDSGGEIETLNQLVKRAIESLDHSGELTKPILQRAAAILAAASPAIAPDSWAGHLMPWQKRKIDAYVVEHLPTTIRSKDLAAMVDLSTSYFARAFRNTYGVPPRQYIFARRLLWAQSLMAADETPLCEIAHVCGFSDQAHFCRSFRNFTGSTPKEWRNAMRLRLSSSGAQSPTPQTLTRNRGSALPAETRARAC